MTCDKNKNYKVVGNAAQSNQIRQAVGDGNFETSRLAQLADNFRYEPV